MTTSEALRAAKARIDHPNKWKRGGGPTLRLCALMALRGPARGADALTLAAKEMGWPSAVELNDSTNHKTVMAMYDLAIKRAEGQA